MKTRTKSALVLVGTLIVGILVGAFATGGLVNRRLDRLQEMRQPASWAMHIQEVIQPVDSTQRRQIAEILRESEQRVFDIRMGFRDDLMTERETLRGELEEILTEEQLERLDRWASRERHRRGPRWRRGGPRGPGPPMGPGRGPGRNRPPPPGP